MAFDIQSGIVRILMPDGSTSGTGFVVSDDGLILTCSHVVQKCRSQERGEPRPDKVQFVFLATGTLAEGRVLAEWWQGCEAEDMAVLQVESKLPTGVQALPLGSSTQVGDLSFQSFGFADPNPVGGLQGRGVILGGTTLHDVEVLQLRSQEITPGFSGAPVWVPGVQRVVGMISDIASLDRFGRQGETAFALKSEVIGRVCPQLSIGPPSISPVTTTEIEAAGIRENDYVFSIPEGTKDLAEAEVLIHQIRKQRERRYPAPVMRRFEPMVLVNRTEELAIISQFFQEDGVSILYITGMPGIGKATLVRGALEFRRDEIPTVWITCRGLDIDQILAKLASGLQFDVQDMLGDQKTRNLQRIEILLGLLQSPTILVFEGFESLLDVNDSYQTEELTELMHALTKFDHRAKVLITSSRLPQGVHAQGDGTSTLRLRGLSKQMAEALFKMHAGIDSQSILPDAAFSKLAGHPTFIKLLASTVKDLPVELVIHSLLTTTNIEAFVIQHILGQVGEQEIEILHAAHVFRDTFTYDMLNSIYETITDGAAVPIQSIRKLIRWSIMETVHEPQLSYYLHPVLRDVITCEPHLAAVAHVAAAKWYLHKPVDPAKVETWDDTLYHLRHAAILGRDEFFFNLYKGFVFDHNVALSYAGWGRRLVYEYRIMASLTEDFFERFNILLRLGEESLFLGEYEDAATIFQERVEFFTEVKRGFLEKDDEQGLQQVGPMLIYSQKRLVEALFGIGTTDSLEEARQLILEIEQEAEEQGNLEYKLDYLVLAFSNARSIEDDAAMARLADESLSVASQICTQSPTDFNKDKLSEAYFMMSLVALRSGQIEQAIVHNAARMQLKLEIGKMSGVAATLSDIGRLARELDWEIAPAYYLTAEQINVEIGIASYWSEEEESQLTRQFLSDSQKIELGRTKLQSLSPRLLPYYQRALDRRLSTTRTS